MNRLSRLYVDCDLVQQATLELDQRACHYVLHVLRLRKTDQLVVFNGRGVDEYVAEIVSRQKEQLKIRILQKNTVQTESLLRIHLGQAISRGERMDYAIQKSVECGVDQITPLFTERGNVKLDKKRIANRLAHWQHIAINATQQSDRTHVPTIHSPLTLPDWLAKGFTTGFVCQPQGDKLTRDLMIDQNSVACLIGPEGGFSQHELQLVNQLKFNRLSLGPRTLRTETAPVVALTLLQHLFGEL